MTSRSRVALRLVLGLALICAWALPTLALTDEEIFRDLRFNFINPGGRSLGMGGAFISLANDATAAQANPAGLGFLTRTEYFAELRMVDNGAQSVVRTESLPTIDTFVATGTNLDDVITRGQVELAAQTLQLAALCAL